MFTLTPECTHPLPRRLCNPGRVPHPVTLTAPAVTSAPAVIFVHGMRTSSAIWDNQLDHVRALGHDALAVDLPAHGIRRGERFTLERSFQVLDEAAASFGPDRKVLVVGLSLGGYTSLAWAARRPKGLIGVVAAACTSDPKGKPVDLYRKAAHAFVTGWTSARRSTGQLAGLWRAGMVGRPSTAGALLDGGGTRVKDTKPSWAIVTDALGELAGQSWLTHLRAIDVPVWLVNGSRDHLRLDERRFLAAATEAELVVVRGAGHDVNSHAPVAFNRALHRALAHVGSATLVA